MTAEVIRGTGRVARVDGIQCLATPRVPAAVIGIVVLMLAAVVIGLALEGLVATGMFLAGPVPEVGPQPGF